MSRSIITLDISNATEEAPVKSELLDIGGHKWQLICPSNVSSDLFAIVCNENCSDNLWLCKAKYRVETKEGNSFWKKLTEPPSGYWFNSNDTVLPALKGNGLGTPNSIKVNIEVEWSASQFSLHPLNATLNMISNGKSHLVPINKHVLAGNSNYFHNFFFGELAAVSICNDVSGNPIYDIHEDQNFNHSQFRFMVHAFLCMGSMVDQIGDMKWFPNDKEQKIALLKLAVKYQLKMFEKLAEKMLIKLGSDTMELLKLADQFTLTGLKEHCLQTITPSEYCKKLGKNIEIWAGLKKETRKLLDAKLEECSNKNWQIV